MGLSPDQVKRKYNAYSFFYNFIEWPIERLSISKWRNNLLKNVHGKVLEIGVGTGKNLRYYDYDKINLTAIDISKGMLKKAKKLASKEKYPVNLQLVDEEKLPFKDNSFDYIVITFVLCSVSNQEKMLHEMKRVVKINGKIILLEHVLSKNKLIAFFEHLHNPITRFLFGFEINRDTINSIKKSGLKIVKEKNIGLVDIFKELVVKKQ